MHLVHRFQIQMMVTIVFGPHIKRTTYIRGDFNVWYPKVYVYCYLNNIFSINYIVIKCFLYQCSHSMGWTPLYILNWV
jgi:hypothetical protein